MPADALSHEGCESDWVRELDRPTKQSVRAFQDGRNPLHALRPSQELHAAKARHARVEQLGAARSKALGNPFTVQALADFNPSFPTSLTMDLKQIDLSTLASVWSFFGLALDRTDPHFEAKAPA